MMTITQQTVAGQTRQIGGIKVTRQAKHVQIIRPFVAFNWHRPHLIRIDEKNGRTTRHIITDFTRLIQLTAWLLSALFIISGWLLSASRYRKIRKNNHEPTHP